MHFDLWEYYALLARSFSVAALALVLPATLILRFAAADYKVMAALLVASLLCFLPVLAFLLFTAAERNSICNVLWQLLGRVTPPPCAIADSINTRECDV
jgi:hypothetical protein